MHIVTFHFLSIHIVQNHMKTCQLSQALAPHENQTIKQGYGWADVFGKSNSVFEPHRDESWCVDVIVKPEYQPLCGVNTPREKNLFPLFISDWRQNLFHSRVCDLICFSTLAYK